MSEIELSTFNRCDDIVLRIPAACIVALTERFAFLTEGREIVVTNPSGLVESFKRQLFQMMGDIDMTAIEGTVGHFGALYLESAPSAFSLVQAEVVVEEPEFDLDAAIAAMIEDVAA